MAIGTVKFFDDAKGFGFIIPEGGGNDVFVHKSALELAGISILIQGQYVTFETEQNAKGAVAVSKIQQHSKECVMNATNEYSSSNNAATFERGSNHKLARRAPLSRLGKAPTAEQLSSIQNQKSSNKFADWQRSYERYCHLAQNTDNDNVMREHYWQYAEHFLRMMNGSSS